MKRFLEWMVMPKAPIHLFFLAFMVVSTSGRAAKAGPVLDWLFGSRAPAPVPVGPPQYLNATPMAPGAIPQGNVALYGNPSYQGTPHGSMQGAPVGPGTGYVQPAPLQTYAPPVVGLPQTQVGALPTAGYASQWNRAAVTYYRPVTSLDPATGTTVTRMMPCTSYELQNQRSPMLSMRPALGYYPQADRWPSMTTPSSGATPVPSSALKSSLGSVPYYGSPVTSAVPYPSVPTWGSTSMMPVPGSLPSGVVQAGAIVPVPSNWPAPLNAASQAIPSGSMFPVPAYHPATTSPVAPSTLPLPSPGYFSNPYPATSSTPIQNFGQPYSSVVPPTSSSVLPSYPSATPFGSAPPSTYSSPVPGSSILPANPGDYSPAGSSNGNWVPVPGSMAPASGSGELQPIPSSPSADPPSAGVRGFDPESQVKPTLERDREEQAKSDVPKFQLRSVMREPLSSEGARRSEGVPNFDRAPNSDRGPNFDREPAADRVTTHLPPPPLPVEPPRTEVAPSPFDSLQPIPAPSNLPEPRWNPGLLDPRDRTASQPGSELPSTKPIQWISAEIDSAKKMKPIRARVGNEPTR